MYLQIIKDNIPKIVSKIKTMDGIAVEYGIFEDSGIHPKSGLTNATLLAIHELRDDKYKRPVLGISIDDNKDIFAVKAINQIKNVIIKSAKGRNPSITTMLDPVGKFAVNETKKIFGDTAKLKSNSKRTIELKGIDSPLIHFGDLKQSISFKIKTKGQ